MQAAAAARRPCAPPTRAPAAHAAVCPCLLRLCTNPTPPSNSAFYVGYTLTNLVGGYLASTTSPKQVLGWGVVIWSLFTISTPAAAGASMPLLLGNRACMGAGEGVTFPCVQSIVKGWVPADTRTRALTLIYSGGQLGTIVALVTSPLIIKVGEQQQQLLLLHGWWCCSWRRPQCALLASPVCGSNVPAGAA